LRGGLDRTDFFYNILAQLAGGVMAPLMAAFMLHCTGAPEIRMQHHETICSLIAEFIGAFAVVYVYLNVMDNPEQQPNGYYGAAVGAVQAALMFVLGPVSGGAFNPATAIGLAIAGMTAWGDVWLYFVGAFLGSGVAMTAIYGALKPPSE
jgi:aquaporin Z